MKDKDIQNKIKQIEELMKDSITLINYDFHHRLLEMHQRYWDLRYFKKHQEKGYLKKVEIIETTGAKNDKKTT